MTFSILLICLIQITLGILASIFVSYAIRNYYQAILQEVEMNPITQQQEVPKKLELTSINHEED